MKFLTRIAVLFYVTMVLFLGSFILLFVLNQIEVGSVLNLLSLIYFDETLRFIFAVVAAVLLFFNFVFYQAFTVNTHRGKTIAFDNPSGRVSVSLGAIEELTKRVISKISEVRDVKSKISISKKGLQIKITLILRVEGSIPELTSRVQELVKRKVQDAIGLDEPIDVAIYVGKIISDQRKEKPSPKKKEEVQKELEHNVPFQGYRA
jgi:uncharacterized alkaline shock family protein YloU